MSEYFSISCINRRFSSSFFFPRYGVLLRLIKREFVWGLPLKQSYVGKGLIFTSSHPDHAFVHSSSTVHVSVHFFCSSSGCCFGVCCGYCRYCYMVNGSILTQFIVVMHVLCKCMYVRIESCLSHKRYVYSKKKCVSVCVSANVCLVCILFYDFPNLLT